MPIIMTTLAHEIIKKHVKTGDFVIDATCGRGNDTFFLAELVGMNGVVHSYDIQKEALDVTKNNPRYNSNNTYLFHTSHENLDVKNASLCIFNLGYLPKSDKKVTTIAPITIKAIQNVLLTMTTNTLLLITIYPGHFEGALESLILNRFVSELDTRVFTIIKHINNEIKNSPYIYEIRKTRA